MFYFSVTGAQLEPLATDLLRNLFGVLQQPVSEENEYIMKGKKNIVADCSSKFISDYF